MGHIRKRVDPHSHPDTLSVTMDFPPDKAGLVFGRGGKTLTSLKREIGARIVVDSENGFIQISASSMRVIQQAKQAIQQILAASDSHRLIYYNVSDSHRFVRFVPFRDMSLTNASQSDRMYVLERCDSATTSFLPPVSAQDQTIITDELDPQFFVDLDMAQIRAQLFDSLEHLRPQAGHVELLCRFGKMIFTDIPEDLMGAPVPSDAIYNIVRSRQLHFTFEGGAGIPDKVIERTIHKLKAEGEYTCKSIYYLSVLPEVPIAGLDRRRRLDVMLERQVDESGVSINFIGVREPYLKPFKADIISLHPNHLDARVAVRASPRSLSGEALKRVEEFAATIKCAGKLELEYPAKAFFRVTGCALKLVQTIRVAKQNLVVEVVQHEGQENHRRFEFAATTLSLEQVLGQSGAAVASVDAHQWTADDVLSHLDDVIEKTVQLNGDLSC
eukprot:c5114_g1_i1.p1 GENE.c5114_g1_i1~~c5114_g1_i1.p1  ORF type:complete len:443 (-),score=104.60 c5114_g1_i1:49-1377(-)